MHLSSVCVLCVNVFLLFVFAVSPSSAADDGSLEHSSSKGSSFWGNLWSKLPWFGRRQSERTAVSESISPGRSSKKWLEDLLELTPEFRKRISSIIAEKPLFRKRSGELLDSPGGSGPGVNLSDIDDLTDDEIYNILHEQDSELLSPREQKKPVEPPKPAGERKRTFFKRTWPFKKSASNHGHGCRSWGILPPDHFWKPSFRFAEGSKQKPGPIPLSDYQLMFLARELTKRREQRRARLNAERFVRAISKLDSDECVEFLLCDMGAQQKIYREPVKKMEKFLEQFVSFEIRGGLRDRAIELLRAIRFGENAKELKCSDAYTQCLATPREVRRAKVFAAAPAKLDNLTKRSGYIVYKVPKS